MLDVAAHALSRFGLGARPGDRQEIESNPTSWVKSQLSGFADDSAATNGRPTTKEVAKLIFEVRQLQKAQSKGVMDVETQLRAARQKLTQTYLEDINARLRQGFETSTPVIERFVRFWSNHFSISAENNLVSPIIGAFEREVIRTHMNGNFYQLLLAAESHPAMVVYMNNEQSTGPNSFVGKQTALGLNENFAREIMELHTVGVNGGYDQQDVTSFAKILTGWTVEFSSPTTQGFGEFSFDKKRHEPGTQTVMGKHYSAQGSNQAKAVLRTLAKHPSTARFIATKLARHFVSDDPPESAVSKLEQVFLATGGDLPSLYRAVVDLPEAWIESGNKFRMPEDYLIAAGRAVGFPAAYEAFLYDIPAEMGQQTYASSGPNGWEDTASDWITGYGVLRRADVAVALATAKGGVEGFSLMKNLYGENLSRETEQSLRNTRNPVVGTALALASPEFLYY